MEFKLIFLWVISFFYKHYRTLMRVLKIIFNYEYSKYSLSYIFYYFISSWVHVISSKRIQYLLLMNPKSSVDSVIVLPICNNYKFEYKGAMQINRTIFYLDSSSSINILFKKINKKFSCLLIFFLNIKLVRRAPKKKVQCYY